MLRPHSKANTRTHIRHTALTCMLAQVQEVLAVVAHALDQRTGHSVIFSPCALPSIITVPSAL